MAGITNVRSSVICSIPMACPVKGVALLGSRLCVLLGRDFDQIEIFELTDNEYRKQNTISVPGLGSGGVEDMAACTQDDCLYITDSTNHCVNRIKMENDPIQWLVCTRAEQMKPIGVSVTAANNVLVTCQQTVDNSAVTEFTNRGDRVRTIQVKGRCRKAVELPPDKFVVCYAQCRSLRVISSSGDVVWSYDELPQVSCMGIIFGSSAQKLDFLHAALDSDGFIFVSDVREKTVISISANSTVRRVLLASGSGLKGEPGKMCFEPANRRLFVVNKEDVIAEKVIRDRTGIIVMHVVPLSW